MARIVNLLILVVLVLAGCGHTSRERQALPAPAGGLAEVPAPYRLVYENWPTRHIPDFVVIQGGREFILQPDIPPDIPGEVLLK